MRGGLDETLARLARREEARRRRSADQDTEVDDDTPTLAFEATGQAPTAPGWPGPAPAELARTGPGWARPAVSAVSGSDPVEEVAEAVRRVVAAHPGLAVVLRVEYGGQTYPLRVERTDTGARSGRAEAETRAAADPPVTPPPAWPLADRTPPAWTPAREMPGVDPAARLAELIRRDPTLLDNDV
ncbi:hypothetical protein [Micromonospora sp. NBC_00421]|uniref:hypothetical protein n=1 Tax=Micromonospora sp. NBC_00421 TaxID=2975976 RepID=UPI002E20A287